MKVVLTFLGAAANPLMPSSGTRVPGPVSQAGLSSEITAIALPVSGGDGGGLV